MRMTILILLLLNIVLGCLAGAWPRWRIFCVLTWLVVPPVIASSYSIANGLFTEHGESAFFALMGLYVLLPAGFVAYGVAMLFGYLFRTAIEKEPR